MSVRGDVLDIRLALWLAPLLGQHAGAGEERQGGHGDCSSALFGRVCAEASCALERVLCFESCEHPDLAARRGGGEAAAGQIGLALAGSCLGAHAGALVDASVAARSNLGQPANCHCGKK